MRLRIVGRFAGNMFLYVTIYCEGIRYYIDNSTPLLINNVATMCWGYIPLEDGGKGKKGFSL